MGGTEDGDQQLLTGLGLGHKLKPKADASVVVQSKRKNKTNCLHPCFADDTNIPARTLKMATFRIQEKNVSVFQDILRHCAIAQLELICGMES